MCRKFWALKAALGYPAAISGSDMSAAGLAALASEWAVETAFSQYSAPCTGDHLSATAYSGIGVVPLGSKT